MGSACTSKRHTKAQQKCTMTCAEGYFLHMSIQGSEQSTQHAENDECVEAIQRIDVRRQSHMRAWGRSPARRGAKLHLRALHVQSRIHACVVASVHAAHAEWDPCAWSGTFPIVLSDIHTQSGTCSGSRVGIHTQRGTRARVQRNYACAQLGHYACPIGHYACEHYWALHMHLVCMLHECPVGCRAHSSGLMLLSRTHQYCAPIVHAYQDCVHDFMSFSHLAFVNGR